MRVLQELTVAPDRLWDDVECGSRVWREAVQQLTAASRSALLVRADAGWDAPGERSRERALAVYCALRGDLDPATPLDCSRIRRLIEDGPVGAYPELMEATAAHASDPETGHLASLVLAQCGLLAGDAVAAEARYVAAIRVARARGFDRLLADAYQGYARFCLDARRDIEALVLARRGAAAASALGDVPGAAFGQMVEIFALEGLEDWPRLGAAIESLERSLASAPTRLRERMEYGLAGAASDLAVAHGRHADAERLIERAARLGEARSDPSWSRAEVHLVRARGLAARGDLDAARGEVGLGLAVDPDADRVAILRTLDLALQAQSGQPGLRDAAEEWLAWIEDPAATELGAGLLLRVGQDGGSALRRAGGLDDQVRRAYRVAASGALARLAEIARFLRDAPEFATPTADEAAAIADHRSRVGDRESSLRAAVAEVLAEEARAGRRPLAALTADTGLVACCAWCARLRDRAGRWVPLPECLLSLPQEIVPLTHGICPTCLQNVCPDAVDTL